MIERIIIAIFKGIFHLIGIILQALWRAVTGAVAKKGRDVYTAPATPAAKASAIPELPDDLQMDENFVKVDQAIGSGNFLEAVRLLGGPPPSSGATPTWRFNAAHRCWVVWQRWSAALPEPERKETEGGDDWLSLVRRRDLMLSSPLKAGCVHIEALLSAQPDYPQARLLGKMLHGKLAQSGWDFGPKVVGYQHQKRVMELTDGLIDYDTLDLAQRCALEGQVYGQFFDTAELLFKHGKIEADNHLYAAMVHEGAVHSEKWPLSDADRKRAPEFLKAALGHLEYCQKHKQETGPHWHNIMARVVAGLGNLDDSAYHFQCFKNLAAKLPDGEAMIAVFGKDTIKVYNHYVKEHNASIDRSRRR